MNLAVQQKWETLRDHLRREVSGANDVAAYIPNWPATGLEEALRWMQASIYEGYNVAFSIQKTASSTNVWLKKWEFGEDEPEWPLSTGT